MGIWKKISDLARSNMNELLNQLEDPKKLADLAILELEENKKRAKILLIKAMASTKMALLHQESLKNQIIGLKDQAEAFLRQSNEAKTKEILLEKQELEQEAKNLKDELLKEQQEISALNHGLSALEQKINYLKSSSSIKASTQYLEKEDSFHTFSRMEDKIENNEFALGALNELLAQSEQKEALSKIPKTSFDQHSDPAAIEKELLAMKKKLSD